MWNLKNKMNEYYKTRNRLTDIADKLVLLLYWQENSREASVRDRSNEAGRAGESVQKSMQVPW